MIEGIKSEYNLRIPLGIYDEDEALELVLSRKCVCNQYVSKGFEKPNPECKWCKGKGVVITDEGKAILNLIKLDKEIN